MKFNYFWMFKTVLAENLPNYIHACFISDEDNGDYYKSQKRYVDEISKQGTYKAAHLLDVYARMDFMRSKFLIDEYYSKENWVQTTIAQNKQSSRYKCFAATYHMLNNELAGPRADEEIALLTVEGIPYDKESKHKLLEKVKTFTLDENAMGYASYAIGDDLYELSLAHEGDKLRDKYFGLYLNFSNEEIAFFAASVGLDMEVIAKRYYHKQGFTDFSTNDKRIARYKQVLKELREKVKAEVEA